MVLHYGDYYILDLNGKVIDTHIDPNLRGTPSFLLFR